MNGTNGTITLLVDTNVWLDHYLARADTRPAATELLSLAVRDERLVLAYSSMTAKDVFFIMGRTLKAKLCESSGVVDEGAAAAASEVAWGCVENMAELAHAVPADESDMWIARKCRTECNDFEDALIVAAAQRAQADYVVTNDAQLLRQLPALAISPQALLDKLGK